MEDRKHLDKLQEPTNSFAVMRYVRLLNDRISRLEDKMNDLDGESKRKGTQSPPSKQIKSDKQVSNETRSDLPHTKAML